MNKPDQARYLKEFKKFAKKVNASKEVAEEFYRAAGILTPKGNLTRRYYHGKSPRFLKAEGN